MNISVGDNSKVNVSGNYRKIAIGRDQINSATDLQQMTELLEELLHNTDRNDANHRALRGAVREIQDAIEDEQQLPKDAETWIDQAIQGVKLTPGLLVVIERLKGLWS